MQLRSGLVINSQTKTSKTQTITQLPKLKSQTKSQTQTRSQSLKTQSQIQTPKIKSQTRIRTPSQKFLESQIQTPKIKSQTRIRTPSQKYLESQASQKALEALDIEEEQANVIQLPQTRSQSLKTQIQSPKSKSIVKTRIRTPSQKYLESQVSQKALEALDAEEEQETQTPYSIAEFTQEFFDNSSEEWKSNKIKKSNATYQYRCSQRIANGKRCSKEPHNQFHCQKHMK